ncbi:MAG: cytochrome c [Gemmatimonadota bacterium]
MTPGSSARCPSPCLALVLLAGLAGCASGTPANTGPAQPSAPTATPAAAQPAVTGANAGIYTARQADRGQEQFDVSCSECHATSEFRGRQFMFSWGRRSVGDLFRHIVDNMPEDNPGSLTAQQYVDVVAYILELNDFPKGDVELPPDEDVLRTHRMTSTNDR